MAGPTKLRNLRFLGSKSTAVEAISELWEGLLLVIAAYIKYVLISGSRHNPGKGLSGI